MVALPLLPPSPSPSATLNVHLLNDASSSPWYGVALIGVVGVALGAGISLFGSWLLDNARRKSERDLRLLDRKISAYVDMLAAFEDYCDPENPQNGSTPTDNSKYPDQVHAIDLRVNAAMVAVDILAPVAVSHLSTAAYAVCARTLYDPERVRAMEAITTAIRKDLGVPDPDWQQSLVKAASKGAAGSADKSGPPASA